MTSPEEDRELDELLARRSAMSREYASLGKEEPPAAVDLRVLAAAERAARLPERPLARSRPRWMMPVTLAATVVLSVSIMWLLGKDPTPAVTRLAQNMRGPPPPVVVTLEAPASPLTMPSPITASPAAPAQRLATERASPRAMQEQKFAGVSRTPSAGAVSEMVVTAAAADKRESYAGEPPELTGADLERAIAFLRDRRANSMQAAAPAAAPADSTAGLLAGRSADADVRLHELQRLYEAGDKAGALAALAEFRRRFPQHPLSEMLSRPGP